MNPQHDPAPVRRLAAPRSDDRLIWELHASQHFLLWLAAADELGLFSLLDVAPARPEQVARQLQIGVVAAEGLCGVLAALGFLVQYDGRYGPTQVARDFLLPASPYYRGAWLDAVRCRPPITYDMVATALREDRPIYPDYWEDAAAEPAQVQAQVRGMHVPSFPGASALAEYGNFSQVHRLQDVGGGAGGMSIALALHYPDLHCTVLDQANAGVVAAEFIAAYGVEGRVDTCTADAFAGPWPPGYDAVLLSHVLDSFDAQHAEAILRRAYEYLPPGGSVYIHEMLVHETKDGPLGIMALSLYDHLGSRGQQWTAAQLRAMVEGAGLVDVSLTPTYGSNAVVRVCVQGRVGFGDSHRR